MILLTRILVKNAVANGCCCNLILFGCPPTKSGLAHHAAGSVHPTGFLYLTVNKIGAKMKNNLAETDGYRLNSGDRFVARRPTVVCGHPALRRRSVAVEQRLVLLRKHPLVLHTPETSDGLLSVADFQPHCACGTWRAGRVRPHAPHLRQAGVVLLEVRKGADSRLPGGPHVQGADVVPVKLVGDWVARGEGFVRVPPCSGTR